MKRIAFFLLLLLGTIGIWAQKTIVWHQPTVDEGIYGDGYFNTAIEVNHVELSEKETVLHLRIFQRSDYPEYNRFQIMKSSHLTANGKRYQSRSIDGMKFDEWTNTDKDGKKDFAIHFEPLPMDTYSFDYQEADDDNAWKIKGIRSIENRWEDPFPSYWRNDKTGDWEIAFLKEPYAIYDNKIWNTLIDVNHITGEADGTMTCGNETINVYIGKNKKGKRTISLNGKKAVYSMITDRFLPDYPTKDTRTVFVDTDYKVDTTTIVGWIKDMPQHYRDIKTFDFFCNNIYTNDQMQYPAQLDSLGRFTIKIPLENTTEFFCDWNRCMLRTVLEPGKTYFLLNDFKEGRRMWMGDDCRLQNELFKFPLDWKSIEMEGGAEYNAYIASVDSLINAQYAYIDQLCQQHPTLSTRFNIYRKGNTLWQQARYFGQSRFRTKDYRMSDNAKKYATDTFWRKMEKPYSMHRDMTEFWRDYVDEIMGGSGGGVSVNITDYIEEIASTPEELDILTTWKAFIHEATETINATEDEAEKQRLADEYNEKNKELIEKVNAILNSTNAMKVIHSRMLEMRIQRQSQALDSIGSDKLAKSIMTARMAFNEYEHEHRPLSASQMDSLKVWIDNPAIFSLIEQKNEYYTALQNREFDKLVLKSSDDVAGMTEGEEILKKLLEPYKGKIVLIDVWGTWCGPCKEALTHSQEEYERLSKYDMEYVYLANNSPEDAWENIIKEYNVSGPNVAHFNLPREQQNAIERYLRVNSFPTYKIVDKNGNVLDIDWLDARNLDKLEEVVKQLAE